MKHYKVTIKVKEYIVEFENKKKKTVRELHYSTMEGFYTCHAPCGNIEFTCAENELSNLVSASLQSRKKELSESFSTICGRNTEIKDIRIINPNVIKKPCEEMSIDECMKNMTPKQFFAEFGELALKYCFKK